MTYCPPPPPPPPGLLSSVYHPEFEVSFVETFIPVKYSGECVSDPSRLTRILPFRRNVFITTHRAHPADLNEFEWLFKYGTTETWYERPSKALLKRLEAVSRSGRETDELVSSNPKSNEIQTPKVWASAALTTPLDDDVCKCIADHTRNSTATSYISTCRQCTAEKTKALSATDLVYCLVFNSLQAHETFIPGAATAGGRQIFKLVKCGSRAAAIAEIFHATGLHGWNMVFSCVMRNDNDIGNIGGEMARVEKLWMLSDYPRGPIQIFY